MHLLSSMYFAQEKTKTEDDFIISQRLKGYLKVKLNKVRKDKTLVLKFLKNSKVGEAIKRPGSEPLVLLFCGKTFIVLLQHLELFLSACGGLSD